jgi:hypothetical protein
MALAGTLPRPMHADGSLLVLRRDPLFSQGRRLLGRVSIVLALVGGVTAVPVSVARADPINLAPCNPSALGHPFAPWGDPFPYELAPGGDFETSAWTLNAGAHRVRGSEPYAATGTLGSWSLALPAGSSAESPLTCVDAAYPTVRFFISGTGLVAVSMVVGGIEIPAGVAIATSTWQPTQVMVTTSAVVSALSGGVAQVSLRISALVGEPRVDDVYVDPWCRG